MIIIIIIIRVRLLEEAFTITARQTQDKEGKTNYGKRGRQITARQTQEQKKGRQNNNIIIIIISFLIMKQQQ